MKYKTPDYLKTSLKDHVIRHNDCQSWHVQNPNKFSYWFYITWVRGFLILSGDCGEMVLQHYSFENPKAAANWVNGSYGSPGYFLEKACGVNVEYMEDGNKELIIETIQDELEDGNTKPLKILLDFIWYDKDKKLKLPQIFDIFRKNHVLTPGDAHDTFNVDELVFGYDYSKYQILMDCFKKWAELLYQAR